MGALFAVSLAISAASAMMQAKAAADLAAAQEQEALANAQSAESDAVAQEKKTDFEQMQSLREGEAAMGSLRVNMGASGGRTDVGTNFMVRMQQSQESELDNFLVGLEGRTRQSKLEAEADQYRKQAKYYKKAGSNARISGGLGVANAVLGGLSKYGGTGTTGSTGSAASTSSAGFAGSGSQTTTWGHPYQR